MIRALAYLWLSLLKRRVQHFFTGLRRPTTCIGVASVVFLVGVCFYYRNLEVFAQLVRPESLLGGALVMLSGSLCKGFLQRGLAFEPPDVEFLFTSPFTQRQIILYQLAPSYLFALVQSLVFFGLFASHLKYPVSASFCLFLFQVACFQISTGAAIFAGTLTGAVHHRLRWMMLGVFFLVCALYLRWAWGLKLVPAFAGSPTAQWFFYPAVTLLDVGTLPPLVESIRRWFDRRPGLGHELTRMIWIVAGFALGAGATLWWLLKVKADLFETALGTTTRRAEKRQRMRQGRRESAMGELRVKSTRLPREPFFRGVGAILWKNLLIARRCRRELLVALAFTLIFSGFLAGLLWAFHELMGQSGATSKQDLTDFHRGVTLMLAALGFLLQWTFSFDFRRDGRHLVDFRTLPVSPLAVAMAEVTVSTLFCLGFQALGVLVLMLFAGLDWQVLLLMALGFPAIALALNGVWNLHYLLVATRRAAGHAQSTTTVGTLMVVALSFLVFYPAVRTAFAIGDHAGGNERLRIELAIATGLAVQYIVDFLLVFILAKLFERFEIARDS